MLVLMLTPIMDVSCNLVSKGMKMKVARQRVVLGDVSMSMLMKARVGQEPAVPREPMS